MASPLNPKYKTSRHNELLDLSVPTVKFNVDHLYKLPQTTRSFVFFPYYVNVDEIAEFNKYCKSNHYRIEFVGGESVYGGNTYDVTRDNLRGTNGTMTILLIHEDDDKKDTVSKRLEAYNKETLPLLPYYDSKKVLFSIDGLANIKNVTNEIMSLIK